MSGDFHDNDDADFLDEDFVVEDIAGKNEDLEDLFDPPSGGASASGAASRGDDAAAGDADEEGVLFSDHSAGLNPSERFGDQPGFAEENASQWSGDSLDLDEVGVPAGDAADPEMADARRSFAAELKSMLHGEEDFALDSDKDLEVIRAETGGDGISEFEQSGPFVLEDGDGLWREQVVEGESLASDDEVIDGAMSPAHGDDAMALPLRESAAFDDEQPDEDAGWDPLPGRTVDQLSEVGEIQRSDDDYTPDDELQGQDGGGEDYERVPKPEELEDVDGHDIYAADDGRDDAVVVGAIAPRRGRGLHLFASVAASLMILLAAAAVVLRPEWFGLRIQPDRVERVEVPRPSINLKVSEPPVPAVAAETPAGGDPAGVAQPGPGDGTTPTNGGPGTEPAPGSGAETPVPTPPAGDANPQGTSVPPAGAGETPPNGSTVVGSAPTSVPGAEVPVTPVASGGNDPQGAGAPTSPAGVETLPAPAHGDGALEIPAAVPTWPVAVGGAAEPPPTDAGKPLVRFGDGLMVGDLDSSPGRQAAVDGVLPGSRAFAQLHNGNYFIGSVKCVAANTITLHVDEGEVTLRNSDIERLTELGSADYEALQKATRGFVRLTNNNRLIGGILSRIADDHIVLEFRSNRVMLPKSLIGEIVSGEQQESAVRLDTTSEEDNWLRRLVERQLGTGKGATAEGEPAKPEAPRASRPPQ